MVQQGIGGCWIHPQYHPETILSLAEHARWNWQTAKTGKLTTTTNLPSPELRSPKITFEIGKGVWKVAIRSTDFDKNLDRTPFMHTAMFKEIPG